MTTISMPIDGEPCQARTGATFERRNPLDGSLAAVEAASLTTQIGGEIVPSNVLAA